MYFGQEAGRRSIESSVMDGSPFPGGSFTSVPPGRPKAWILIYRYMCQTL